jgi:hemoglobin
MKQDILNRDDVKLLIDNFYGKVQESEVLGYIFNDIAKVNWEQHLPVMYSFWASMLLGEQSYTGNVMLKHLALSKITPLTEKEISAWISLFHGTVDELFEGEVATNAKTGAENVARVMLFKIQTDAKQQL